MVQSLQPSNATSQQPAEHAPPHPSSPGRDSRLRAAGIAVVCFSFATVFARSLRFVYVEGDDAASISYHLFGRHASIYREFAPYQSGADLLLRGFPRDEAVLRIGAMLLSALAATATVLLALELVRQWLGEDHRLYRQLSPAAAAAITGAVLLAVPELFYLSLVYLPSVIGMAMMLGAHALLRRTLSDPNNVHVRTVVITGILTAAAAAVRWDLVLYVPIMLADLCISRGRAGDRRVLLRIAAIFASVFAVCFGMLSLVVVGISGIAGTTGVTRSRGDEALDLTAAVGNSSALLTPSLVALGAWGLTRLPSGRRAFAVGHVAALVAVVGVLNWTVPKVWLPFLPGLLLSFTVGLVDLWRRARRRFRFVLRSSLAVLLLLPWLVGVRVSDGTTAWGPGFELRSYDDEAERMATLVIGGAGSAVPTPEGQRPLWGHAAVLLGGEWARLVTDLDRERELAVEYALAEGIPLLQLGGSDALLAVALGRRGYRPSSPIELNDSITIRRFDSRGGGALLVKADFGTLVGDSRIARDIEAFAASEEVVIHGYPSALRDAYEVAPQALQKLGPVTAVLDLGSFADALAARGR